MAPLFDRILAFRRIAHACGAALAALGVPSSAFHFADRTRWIVGFAAGCSVLVALALLTLWALTGFADLGLRGHGLIALILGIVFSTGLGSALMALSFYGDRSDRQAEVERCDSEGCGGAG